MTDKQCLSITYKIMLHEFTNCQENIEKFGYKMDGNDGVRNLCFLTELKSVDYLHAKNEEFFLIEFTDLARQHSGILLKIETIKQSNLNKKDQRDYIKGLSSEIQREMREKFIHSLQILHKVKDHFINVPEQITDTLKAFLIVFANFDNDTTDEKKFEIARFIDNLKDNLSNSLPDQLYKEVKLIPLNNLVKSI